MTLRSVREHCTSLIGNSNIGGNPLNNITRASAISLELLFLNYEPRHKSATYELSDSVREIIPSKVKRHHLYAESFHCRVTMFSKRPILINDNESYLVYLQRCRLTIENINSININSNSVPN